MSGPSPSVPGINDGDSPISERTPLVSSRTASSAKPKKLPAGSLPPGVADRPLRPAVAPIENLKADEALKTQLVRRQTMEQQMGRRRTNTTSINRLPSVGGVTNASVRVVRTVTESHPVEGKPGKEKTETKTFTVDLFEHEMAWPELAAMLETSVNFEALGASRGLTDAQALRQQQKYGKNQLKPPPTKSEIQKFIEAFLNFFMGLLFLAAVLCFVIYGLMPSDPINLWIGVVLVIVVIFTSTMEYLETRKTSALFAALQGMLATTCVVVRDGRQTTVPAVDLVPGDIVCLRAGDRVPADCRILECSEFKVDNSQLTGESEPQQCTVEVTSHVPLETHNLCFNSSLSMNGTAKGLVVRIGQETVIGLIATSTTSQKGVASPLEKEVRYFVRVIGIMSLVLGILFFVVGTIREPTRTGILNNIINAMGLMIANVPEGLPLTVTVCLTVAARKLLARNVMVKKLEYVETLGSVTVIASDKTGTLTQNIMTVANLWYDDHMAKMEAPSEGDRGSFPELFKIAALCNRAQFDATSTGVGNARKVIGDASEAALLRFVDTVRPIDTMRAEWNMHFEIPFNSSNKWQLSIHSPRGANPRDDKLLLIKGAPEVILNKCDTYMVNGNVVDMDDDFKDRFNAANDYLGGMGQRVLGFAMMLEMHHPEDDAWDRAVENLPVNAFTFVGLISLVDPPRPGVPLAVQKCRSAGIRVFMVTGDHPNTAQAIARQVNILSLPTRKELAAQRGCRPEDIPEAEVQCQVVKGDEIDKLTEADWNRVLGKREIVFARMQPQHKLAIVENCQRLGEIVAVTGDGVNDAPALKRANIGVAMGLVGTEVAKNAANLILLDDDFSSIVMAVEEGRVIFDNLKKSICYVLTHLSAEAWPFILNVACGLPQGLSAVLLLWVDLGTELAPGMAFAYEPAEADIMNRPPRSASDRLVDRRVMFFAYARNGTIQTFGCLFVFFMIMWSRGFLFSSKLITANGPYFIEGAPNYQNPGGGREFTAAEQMSALYDIQSSWFVAIVVQQSFNLFVCKTRSVSVFTQGFRNWRLFASLLISYALAVLLIYPPTSHAAFGATDIGWLSWVCMLPGGFCMFFHGEVSKVITRCIVAREGDAFLDRNKKKGFWQANCAW